MEDGQARYLVIWPHGFEVADVGGTVVVTDPTSAAEVSVDGRITLVGGEQTDRDTVERLVGRSIPEGCPGPYWLTARLELPS
jgi:hypothetical protein